jgi:hypothetical protein
MKNIMSKQNLMYIGIGLATAFVVYKVLESREKANEKASNTTATKSADATSSFCGCGA